MKLNKFLKFALPILGIGSVAITVPIALTSCGSNGYNDNISNDACLNLINNSFTTPTKQSDGKNWTTFDDAKKDYENKFYSEFNKDDLKKDLNTWCYGILTPRCVNWSLVEDSSISNIGRNKNIKLVERNFETYKLDITNFNERNKTFSFTWTTYDYKQYANANTVTISNEVPRNYDCSSWINDPNVLSQIYIRTTYSFKNVKIIPELYALDDKRYVSSWRVVNIESLECHGKINFIKWDDSTPISKERKESDEDKTIHKLFNEVRINQYLRIPNINRSRWSYDPVSNPVSKATGSSVLLDPMVVLSPSLDMLYTFRETK